MRARIAVGMGALAALMACRPEPGYRDSDWGDETTATGSACERWVGHAEDAADATGLDVALIMGVMRVESSFREDAESGAGAVGLMQVMPSTGEHYGCDDLSDGESNVRCGARVLADYVRRVDGDVEYGLAAYNAGLANAQRWKRAGKRPANIDYVRHVLRYREQFADGGCAALGPGLRTWEGDGRASLKVTDDAE
jgi:soluble lytic murein transglycosylase-like protein